MRRKYDDLISVANAPQLMNEERLYRFGDDGKYALVRRVAQSECLGIVSMLVRTWQIIPNLFQEVQILITHRIRGRRLVGGSIIGSSGALFS